ncbi:hypothetical protein B5X24_HaOG202128 [Helicoverpa armigera]|uniref:Uncharacterized protein n=1 Tax=Helicoverpa armigera TaxID=29058 RepID=A0A2W1C2U1_HELAM|nr:hypothetical protein B5X24_HaOG202128 [Helicoverpa armigera]
MGKRKKSAHSATEGLVVKSEEVKNNTRNLECSDNEPKNEETHTTSDVKPNKRKKKNQSQTNQGATNTNKKIIFNDDDGEPVEVNNPTNQRKETDQSEFSQENEEDIKDEDIDKFCDELNEEDNEQYETWVKLLEEKLNQNKKKPK